MPGTGAVITLDGSYMEGGGALLRTAISMSAITEQPLRITGVRGGTRFPGLDPEDLTLIRALSESTSAEIVGAYPASETLSFLPTRRPKGISGLLASVRSQANRGSNALVILNTLAPILARSGVYSSLSAEGETFGMNALGFDAFQNVTLPAFRKLGLYATVDQLHAGFGRESRGEVSMELEPSALVGIDWSERGALREIRAVVTTANLPSTIADRAASHLRTLAKQANVPMEIEKCDVEASTPGAVVTVWAQYENGFGSGTSMGSRGVRVETVAHGAFEEVLDFIEAKATVDPYLADQILIPCILAEGKSTFRVSRLTQRFLTQVWVIKQFIPIRLTVKGSEGHAGIVTIERS